MIWAMSLAEWQCAVPGCGQRVAFVDALWIDRDEVFACLHREHVDV